MGRGSCCFLGTNPYRLSYVDFLLADGIGLYSITCARSSFRVYVFDCGYRARFYDRLVLQAYRSILCTLSKIKKDVYIFNSYVTSWPIFGSECKCVRSHHLIYGGPKKNNRQKVAYSHHRNILLLLNSEFVPSIKNRLFVKASHWY